MRKLGRDLSSRVFWSSHLPSRNIKIKIYSTVILPLVLCGCEMLSLHGKGRIQMEGV
jgi:hypothetical protein